MMESSGPKCSLCCKLVKVSSNVQMSVSAIFADVHLISHVASRHQAFEATAIVSSSVRKVVTLRYVISTKVRLVAG